MTHSTHKTRLSDSSLYDEVCTLCGATDGLGDIRLVAPCPSVPTPTAYVLKTKINEVNEVHRQIHVAGSGPNAVFRSESRGFFLLLEGSYEAIHVGFDKPAFEVGDEIEIVIRRAG